LFNYYSNLNHDVQCNSENNSFKSQKGFEIEASGENRHGNMHKTTENSRRVMSKRHSNNTPFVPQFDSETYGDVVRHPSEARLLKDKDIDF
jgi:hypothetical protein